METKTGVKSADGNFGPPSGDHGIVELVCFDVLLGGSRKGGVFSPGWCTGGYYFRSRLLCRLELVFKALAPPSAKPFTRHLKSQLRPPDPGKKAASPQKSTTAINLHLHFQKKSCSIAPPRGFDPPRKQSGTCDAKVFPNFTDIPGRKVRLASHHFPTTAAGSADGYPLTP